jgi:hypothetical protein
MSELSGSRLIPAAQAFDAPQAEQTPVEPSQPHPHAQPQCAAFKHGTARLAIGPQQEELEELLEYELRDEELLLEEELDGESTASCWTSNWTRNYSSTRNCWTKNRTTCRTRIHSTSCRRKRNLPTTNRRRKNRQTRNRRSMN